ncbi:hypothetical protein LX32DRAFT_658499 [Colletotrichum zoysiae]|uniref:Hydrophobin n=1 Tax=Colletotrichum zoysiae TaxID=1216348 RepID=A0AAD9LWX9_9PEZI|nr:hypothetical protein LX32DRAFT_658499 [Colletotrichum zoysiae]
MKTAAVTPFAVAVLAAAAWAAPVDPEQQHPMVSAGDSQIPVAAEVAAPAKVQPNPISPVNLITAVWNALAHHDETERREDLGQACFCSSGSICCNTSLGLDCTHGLCGL